MMDLNIQCKSMGILGKKGANFQDLRISKGFSDLT